MDKLAIVGGKPLDGEVRISGAKNAALPILAATLLADGPVTLRNVPKLDDIATTMKLLKRMGVAAEHRDDGSVTVDAGGIKEFLAPVRARQDDARVDARARAAGRPLRARRRVAAGRLRDRRAAGRICTCGAAGDGRDDHDRRRLHPGARAKLKGARIVLDTVTVTGTENLMMAAASPRARP